MKNKVNPFYIRITEDMNPQTVQDAFDKCVAAGAKNKSNPPVNSLCDWSAFGVTSRNNTFFSNFIPLEMGANAKEITLDQLDEWLGIADSPKQVEWKNGDKCSYKADNESHTFIGMTANDKCCIRYDTSKNLFEVGINEISKPETPEQKEERERLEAAYDLYCEWRGAGDMDNVVPFVGWKAEPDFRNKWLRIVDKTNYRKQ